MKTLDDIKLIIYPKTPHQVMYDKLMDDLPIIREDIEALDMFNDSYIDMLMASGQTNVRMKMLEAMTRNGMEDTK